MLVQTANKINAVYGDWQSKQTARALVEMAAVQFTADEPGAATHIKIEVRITPTGQATATKWVPMASVEEAERVICEKMAALS